MNRWVDTLVVTSCDEAYFPLAKGMFLSLLDKLPSLPGIGLAFVDAGCGGTSISWLEEQGIEVVGLGGRSPGVLADDSLGYQRAQIARVYLPRRFEGVSAFIWMDADTWMQDSGALEQMRSAVRSGADAIVISPECHYSYSGVHENPEQRCAELYSYYAPAFGHSVAERMCRRPVLNTGVVGIPGSHAIWRDWAGQLESAHVRGLLSSLPPAARHMFDQTALNVIVARNRYRALLLDPLCNYLCLWTPPIRDDSGVVRVSLPPQTAVSVVHLAGGWKHFGKTYWENGLLYKQGKYLTDEERFALLSEREAGNFR